MDSHARSIRPLRRGDEGRRSLPSWSRGLIRKAEVCDRVGRWTC